MRLAAPRLIGMSFVSVILLAQQRYPAAGLVLEIDMENQTITVSHQPIPGFMSAMAMPFHVKSANALTRLHVGDSVAFTLLVDRDSSWVDAIHVVAFDSAERDPALASRLKTLDAITRKPEAQLAVGEKTDFRLTDQNRQSVKLSDFEGKVVALNFIYTRCPLPDYCFRLSNNFARLQKRFSANAGLVLLTVTFDAAHDGPEELAQYARIWKANPNMWRFLTGTPEAIQQVCDRFGVRYWPEEGVFTHTLHTVILDREGKLVTNLEGNKFTAEQLGDLVQTVLTGSR